MVERPSVRTSRKHLGLFRAGKHKIWSWMWRQKNTWFEETDGLPITPTTSFSKSEANALLPEAVDSPKPQDVSIGSLTNLTSHQKLPWIEHDRQRCHLTWSFWLIRWDNCRIFKTIHRLGSLWCSLAGPICSAADSRLSEDTTWEAFTGTCGKVRNLVAQADPSIRDDECDKLQLKWSFFSPTAGYQSNSGLSWHQLEYMEILTCLAIQLANMRNSNLAECSSN